MATNLDLELNQPEITEEGQEGLRRLLTLIDQQPRRVIARLRARVLFLRPSFAVRLHHLRPFVVWLLDRPVEYVAAESEEVPE
jgi:hypothetical protein